MMSFRVRMEFAFLELLFVIVEMIVRMVLMKRTAYAHDLRLVLFIQEFIIAGSFGRVHGNMLDGAN